MWRQHRPLGQGLPAGGEEAARVWGTPSASAGPVVPTVPCHGDRGGSEVEGKQGSERKPRSQTPGGSVLEVRAGGSERRRQAALRECRSEGGVRSALPTARALRQVWSMVETGPEEGGLKISPLTSPQPRFWCSQVSQVLHPHPKVVPLGNPWQLRCMGCPGRAWPHLLPQGPFC